MKMLRPKYFRTRLGNAEADGAGFQRREDERARFHVPGGAPRRGNGNTAQGRAQRRPGIGRQNGMSPERAASSVIATPAPGKPVISPFQGSSIFCRANPGRCPGLYYDGLSGLNSASTSDPQHATRNTQSASSRRRLQGSVLIVVLWVVFGLIAMTLYFAHSMAFELRASDNRVASVESEQAIEGARRYITCVLSNVNQAGTLPDPTTYQNNA